MIAHRFILLQQSLTNFKTYPLNRNTSSSAVLDRSELLHRTFASGIHWDLVVIGGGATGLGIALEAASRKYRVLLIEQSDFAKGTSSRSTKLVHGGVRYLAQGNVRLVREASIERGILLRNAPHLVKNQTFLVPVYSLWDRIKYTAGLKLYDSISGSLSLGKSEFIGKAEALDRMPGINGKGLLGAVLYHDGQFDDSRLAINLVQTIWSEGGHALNYMQATGMVHVNGRITGVNMQDLESGVAYEVQTKAVVNATGVFADNILQMDQPGMTRTLAVSQGVHLVVNRNFLPGNDALMIPRTSDGRVLFAVPWHDALVLGTTDTPVDSFSLEPRALEAEIDFILNNAGAYLTRKPDRRNVLSVFAGLRPLAAPAEGRSNTKEISRSHRIIVSPSGLHTMIGGKWTTYRKMGEEMIDAIERALQHEHRPSVTATLRLAGYTTHTDFNDPLYYYGVDADALNNDERSLSDRVQLNRLQVVHAVHHEMARTVEDVLARRVRILFTDAREALRLAPFVAAIMARELTRSESWIQQQLIEFEQLASGYLLKQ